jgi:hypothetical protein
LFGSPLILTINLNQAMENKTDEKGKIIPDPQDFIHYFFCTYTVIDVKGELWKWMVLSTKNESLRPHVQTNQFAAFYNDLNKLITSVYQLHKAQQ